jgi:hypothetical protein
MLLEDLLVGNQFCEALDCHKCSASEEDIRADKRKPDLRIALYILDGVGLVKGPIVVVAVVFNVAVI